MLAEIFGRDDDLNRNGAILARKGIFREETY
jgi:hypothetical protein